MPMSAPRMCGHAGCGATATYPDRYCQAHRKDMGGDSARGAARSCGPTGRGYDSTWIKLRRVFLAEHPLCANPYGLHDDLPPFAEIVDHIVPISEGGERLDEANLQALCRRCHARKHP